MKVYLAASDTDYGLQVSAFATEREMEDWIIDAVGGSRAEFDASGQDLGDYVERQLEGTIDSVTWDEQEIVP